MSLSSCTTKHGVSYGSGVSKTAETNATASPSSTNSEVLVGSIKEAMLTISNWNPYVSEMKVNNARDGFNTSQLKFLLQNLLLMCA
jgi:translation initiation factor 4G